MRVALIENDVVQTVLEADSLTIWPDKLLVQSDTAMPGWLYQNGVFAPPARSLVEDISTMTYAVQNYLDTTAKAKGYDSILSACSYAGGPNPFQTEAKKFVLWRGNVWTACYAILSAVEAGTRTIPTVDELLAELPTLSV